MLKRLWSEESGIATFEFAVTVLLLMSVILGVLAAMDAIYLRTVTQHVATAVGRQAIYAPEGHWAEVIQGGREMMAANLGVQPVSNACKSQCNSECSEGCADPSPATCITISEERASAWETILGLINATVTTRVDHYVSIPVISQSRLFPQDMQCIKVGAEYKVNKWNAGIIFNTPQR